METMAPMPFIIGAPRSGTTLLRMMLDSHLRGHDKYVHARFAARSCISRLGIAIAQPRNMIYSIRLVYFNG